MATDPLERAVLAAARSLVSDWKADRTTNGHGLIAAVNALDAADLPQEIAWHEVASGDQLKSLKNGRFYPVSGVIVLKDGRRQITIGMPTGQKAIVRPTPEEPSAFVKRGRDGVAVDMFVNVFTSGGA